jgi:hypothetical protein
MATATIVALKTEITRLEKELEKHRRALQILEGGDRPQPKPARPARATPPPSIKGLILEVLRAEAPQQLTPSQIMQQLSQQGRAVTLHNIHSRLSELTKAKTVKREAGQYWMES